MNTVKRLFTFILTLLGCASFAAEVIPPKPAQWFNDYANVVSSGTRQQLNQRLQQFERETSSQVVVAVFPKLQSDSSIEDYTVRVAQSWKVGQKDKDNGAVLFVFVQDRKMYLQVGYGLEGALPDALCKRIIEDEIKPHFRNGNFDAGLTAGVNAILAATKGEYKGTGRTVAEPIIIRGNSQRSSSGSAAVIPILFLIFFLFVIALAFGRGRRGRYYHTGGWSSGGWGGGGWSGGGGGGGFSGGGGSFGGGGAGGSW